jgi:hypothetical protein
VGLGEFGVRLHCCFGLLKRFIEALQACQGDGVVEAHFSVVRPDANGAGELVFGLREISAGGEQVGQITEGVGVIGFGFERAAECALGFREIFGRGAGCAENGPGVGQQGV